jgi:RNA polymerase sigma-70 factor (ECF subfamily)
VPFDAPIAAATHGDALEASLRTRLHEARPREAWPGVVVDDDAFVAWLAEKVRAGDTSLEAVAARLEPLFLSWACLQKDAAAIACFERAYFEEVDAAYRRFDSLPIGLDDVRQRVREKLFLSKRPALLAYTGTGDLRGWFRATVLHFLVNVLARETRERPTDERFFDVVVDASPDAEVAYLKQACSEQFEQAFGVAMARLEPREKLLLRYAFADGLTVDQIAPIFRVHRATAARWVAKARARVVDETLAALKAALQIDDDTAGSIVRAALSRMGVSLFRRFG